MERNQQTCSWYHSNLLRPIKISWLSSIKSCSVSLLICKDKNKNKKPCLHHQIVTHHLLLQVWSTYKRTSVKNTNKHIHYQKLRLMQEVQKLQMSIHLKVHFPIKQVHSLHQVHQQIMKRLPNSSNNRDWSLMGQKQTMK